MQKNNNKNKRISPNVIAVIGTILTLIGGFFLSYNYVQKKKVIAFDYMANIFYDEQSKENVIENNEEKNKKEAKEEQNNDKNDEINYDYIGYLEIPKINLYKGFVDVNSPNNNVETNIYIAGGSSYPDVENGNLIIAAHSGSGWKAFFNDLYKLKIGNKAIIKYNGKKYNYTISNIYKQQKKGTIAIYRNYKKTTLTLVTCTNNDNTSQTVYIAELESIE